MPVVTFDVITHRTIKKRSDHLIRNSQCRRCGFNFNRKQHVSSIQHTAAVGNIAHTLHYSCLREHRFHGTPRSGQSKTHCPVQGCRGRIAPIDEITEPVNRRIMQKPWNIVANMANAHILINQAPAVGPPPPPRRGRGAVRGVVAVHQPRGPGRRGMVRAPAVRGGFGGHFHQRGFGRAGHGAAMRGGNNAAFQRFMMNGRWTQPTNINYIENSYNYYN